MIITLVDLKEKTDLQKIEDLLKSFEYEDNKKKVYCYKHYGSSSFGAYLKGVYIFKIDKLKKTKGTFTKVINSLNTFFTGGIKENLILRFIPYQYSAHKIFCKRSLVSEIKEKLTKLKINEDVEIIY